MSALFNTFAMHTAFGSICELGLNVTKEIHSRRKMNQSVLISYILDQPFAVQSFVGL